MVYMMKSAITSSPFLKLSVVPSVFVRLPQRLSGSTACSVMSARCVQVKRQGCRVFVA